MKFQRKLAFLGLEINEGRMVHQTKRSLKTLITSTFDSTSSPFLFLFWFFSLVLEKQRKTQKFGVLCP